MRRHELDLASLVWGVLFLAIAAVGAANVVAGTTWRIDARWLVPGVLVALGGLGLATALSPRRDDAGPAGREQSDSLLGVDRD